MGFRKLKSMYNRHKKLSHQIRTADLTGLVGKKAKLTKKYVDWIKTHADEVGIPYSEVEFIKTKPVGMVTEVRYHVEDGFTFRVSFDDDFYKLVGIDDINIMEE